MYFIVGFTSSVAFRPLLLLVYQLSLVPIAFFCDHRRSCVLPRRREFCAIFLPFLLPIRFVHFKPFSWQLCVSSVRSFLVLKFRSLFQISFSLEHEFS